jgi:hypothetical protein
MQNCDPQRNSMETALGSYQSSMEASMQRVADEEARRMEEHENAPNPHVSFEVDIDWENKEFDIPKVNVTMNPREMSFKAPQVTMIQRDFSFDSVAFEMETVVVGYKPEVTCESISWRRPLPRCTTTMTPIYGKMPVPRKKRVEFSTKVPEVAMRDVRLVASVPEITVTSQRVVFKLPEIRLKSIYINPDGAGRDAERRKEELERAVAQSQERIENVVLTARGEAHASVVPQVNEYFTCVRSSMLSQREATAKLYETTIAQLEAVIGMLVANGGGDTAEAAEYREKVQAMKGEAEQQLSAMDVQIQALNGEELKLVAALVGEKNLVSAQ